MRQLSHLRSSIEVSALAEPSQQFARVHSPTLRSSLQYHSHQCDRKSRASRSFASLRLELVEVRCRGLVRQTFLTDPESVLHYRYQTSVTDLEYDSGPANGHRDIY